MESNFFYKTLAQSILVKEIAIPIKGIVNPDDQIGSVWDNLMEEGSALDDIYIVSESDNVFGYLTLESEGFSGELIGTSRECADKIKPEQILPESFPIIDLYEMLLKEWVYFVKTGGQITHFITWSCINSLPSQLCIYILIIELEAEISRVLYYKNFYEFNKLFIETLEPALLEKINRRYINYKARLSSHKYYHRHDNDDQDDIFAQVDYREYIPWMTLSEKTKMIIYYPTIINQLHIKDRKELISFLNQIVDLRNKFAHGNMIWENPYSPDKVPFLRNIRQLKRTIAKLKEIRE